MGQGEKVIPSTGSHMVQAGVNLRIIQESLGHKSSKTTELYTRVASCDISNVRNAVWSQQTNRTTNTCRKGAGVELYRRGQMRRKKYPAVVLYRLFDGPAPHSKCGGCLNREYTTSHLVKRWDATIAEP